MGISRFSVQIGSDLAIPHNHLGITHSRPLGREFSGRVELVHVP